MLTFDETRIVNRLALLPAWTRPAFAAAAASRLLPSFRVFHTERPLRDRGELDDALGVVWDNIPEIGIAKTELDKVVDRTLMILPSEILSTSEFHPFAEDAVTSVAYALRALASGEPQEAAWAARHVYEAVDCFATSQICGDSTSFEKDRKILEHPAVQLELSRQQRDLSMLAQSLCLPAQETITRLREAVSLESAIPM